MKKLRIFLVLIFLFSNKTFHVYGQESILEIGLAGGPNMGSLRGNQTVDQYHSSGLGFSYGLCVQYNFSKTISMQAGCYYESMVSSLLIELADPSMVDKHKMGGRLNFRYLTVPVLVRATFGKKLRYFVNAGPYAGLLLKETTYVTSYGVDIKSDDTKDFVKTQTGVCFGLGIAYPLGKRCSVSFEARNNLGLTNISTIPVMDNGSIKTNSLNFLFGLGYKIGKRTSS